MKKLIYCFVVMIASLSLKAQDGERIFKRFKGDVSLGYAAPLNSDANGGVLFAMEPKFAVMDQLAVGLRIEGAVMARFTGSRINGNLEADNAKAAGSYIATADYYFTNNYPFRPFAGAGLGVFATAEDAASYSDELTSVKFGGIIRIGAEVKHFRFGVEYNIIPGSNVTIYGNSAGAAEPAKIKNSYIGVKAGFCFGGGPL